MMSNQANKQKKRNVDKKGAMLTKGAQLSGLFLVKNF